MHVFFVCYHYHHSHIIFEMHDYPFHLNGLAFAVSNYLFVVSDI